MVINLRDVTERRRVAEQQAAVAALGQWALSGTALPELLDAAAALIARTLDLPLCGVFELLPGAEELRLVAGVGWERGAVGVVTAPTGVHGLSEYELAWMPPVTIGDLDTGTHDHRELKGGPAADGPPFSWYLTGSWSLRPPVVRLLWLSARQAGIGTGAVLVAWTLTFSGRATHTKPKPASSKPKPTARSRPTIAKPICRVVAVTAPTPS